MNSKSRIFNADDVAGLILGMGTLSLLLFAIVILLRDHDYVRAVGGSLGTMMAVVTAGVGLWASVRLRSRRLLAVSSPAVIAAFCWSWSIWWSLKH